jgi:sterol desaturase/sphingolipid hydroxylase (fatty acid hydroxylase superfamily)
LDIWDTFWHALKDPLRYPVDIHERIYIGYLASAFIFAIFVYQYLRRQDPESVPRNVLAYLFPKRIYFHKSAIADYKFFLVDRVVLALTLPLVALLIDPIADQTAALLAGSLGPAARPWNPHSPWVLAGATLSQIVLVDFVLFYFHYLFHKFPVLWEFHKVHHSAEVMTPVTAYRMHPVEVVLEMNATAIASGVLYGCFAYMTAGSHPQIVLFGINAVQFAFYVIAFNLRHSHIPLGYGRIVSQVFVSPWMHQLHHSRETPHLDKNMGFIFSFWDRMFGTLYIPRRGESFALGLHSGEHVRFHGVSALYFRPFANLARRLKRLVRPMRAV